MPLAFFMWLHFLAFSLLMFGVGMVYIIHNVFVRCVLVCIVSGLRHV